MIILLKLKQLHQRLIDIKSFIRTKLDCLVPAITLPFLITNFIIWNLHFRMFLISSLILYIQQYMCETCITTLSIAISIVV